MRAALGVWLLLWGCSATDADGGAATDTTAPTQDATTGAPGDVGASDALPSDSAAEGAVEVDDGAGPTEVGGAEVVEPPDFGVCLPTATVGCGGEAVVHAASAGEDLVMVPCGVWPALEQLPSTGPLLAVVPEVAGRVTVRITSDTTATTSLYARVMSGADCDLATCVPVTSMTTFDADAGSPTFVSLGSWLGEGGDGVVRVDCCAPMCAGRTCGPDGCGGTCGQCGAGQPCDAAGQCGSCEGADCVCVPSCAGRACGTDGCGGTCGECGEGQLCTLAGACVIPAFGGNDTCASAELIVALPFEAVASIGGPVGGAADDVSPNNGPDAAIVPLDGCVRSLPGGRDVVYRFTAPHAMTLAARLVSLSDGPCGGRGQTPARPRCSTRCGNAQPRSVWTRATSCGAQRRTCASL